MLETAEDPNAGVITACNTTYDADRNLTAKFKLGVHDREFFWSAESQLDSVISNDFSKVKFDYDAFGRVVRKWYGDVVSGTTVNQYFLWDGDQLLAILASDFTRAAEWVHEPGTIDQPFALIEGSLSPTHVRFIQQDELGNVIGHHAPSTPTQTVSYDAWGTPTISGNTQNSLWEGLLWQGDVVSLYCMRNRWYDPEFGRFISEDPIGLAGGINQYTFVNNDPINGRDPSGLGMDCSLVIEYKYYLDDPLRTPIAGTIRVIGTIGECGGGGESGGTTSSAQPTPPSARRRDACNAAPGVLPANIRAAERNRDAFWFRSQVKDRGPWDYKRADSSFEAFGNFHYGVVGRAAGIHPQILLRMAGRNQMQKSSYDPAHGVWWGDPPYGDQPRDQMLIRLGMEYYGRGCR